MPTSRAVLVVFLVAVAVFGQTVAGGFVWDDLMLIEFNEYLREPGAAWRSLTMHFWDVSMPTGAVTAYWRPLVKLSHVLLYRMADGAPWPFHLFNVLLHGLNAVLAGLWARRRLQASGFPDADGLPVLLTGLVFAVHPSRFEAVGWISCSTELFFGAFALLAALAFEARSWWGVVAVLGAAFSKETAIIFPVLFACDAFLRGELKRRVPWLIGTVAAIALVWVIRFQVGISAPPAPAKSDLLTIAQRSLGALFTYFRRTFFPSDVTMLPADYELVAPGRFDVPLLVVLGGAVLAVGWLVLGLSGLRKPGVRWWLNDALWWLIPLGPVLQLRQFPSPVLVADRFLYLPVAAVGLLLTRLALTLEQRHRRALWLGLGGLGVGAVVMLSMALPTYENNRRFFEREFVLHPNSLFTAETYARALEASGNTYASQRVFEQILTRDVPEYRRVTLVSMLAASYSRTVRDSQKRELTQLATYFDRLFSGGLEGLELGDRSWPISQQAIVISDIRNMQDIDFLVEHRMSLHSRLGRPNELLGHLTRQRRKEPTITNTLELARQLAIADRWTEATAVLQEDSARLPGLSDRRITRFVLEAAKLKPQTPMDALAFAIQRANVFSTLGAPRRARAELQPFVLTQADEPRLVHARVQAELSDIDFDAALKILDDALVVHAGDEELKNARTEVELARTAWRAHVDEELELTTPLGL